MFVLYLVTFTLSEFAISTTPAYVVEAVIYPPLSIRVLLNRPRFAPMELVIKFTPLYIQDKLDVLSAENTAPLIVETCKLYISALYDEIFDRYSSDEI